MAQWQFVLDQLREQGIEVPVVVGGRVIRAVIHEIDDDHVTLRDLDSSDRYDLHHSAVVILGSFDE